MLFRDISHKAGFLQIHVANAQYDRYNTEKSTTERQAHFYVSPQRRRRHYEHDDHAEHPVDLHYSGSGTGRSGSEKE